MNKNFSNTVKEAKENELEMVAIIDKMKPLINAYRKKIFFMDKDDAEQEMKIAVIEAVKAIKKCDNDGQCLTYIVNAVKFKYVGLCKKNIYKEKYESPSEESIDKIFSSDEISSIDFKIDMLNRINDLSGKQKQILKYLLLEYSDNEIAEELHMSRQYINRIKKIIGKKVGINHRNN